MRSLLSWEAWVVSSVTSSSSPPTTAMRSRRAPLADSMLVRSACCTVASALSQTTIWISSSKASRSKASV